MHLHKRATVNRREVSGHTELGALGLNGRDGRHSRDIVESPSGKALDFDSSILHRFESYLDSQRKSPLLQSIFKAPASIRSDN